MPATISFRESLRWIPDPASESTHTVVLTGGKTGVFLDVRFFKQSNELDWAFAGYRSTVVVNNKEATRFTHLIDSRTKDPSQIADLGFNTALPDGTVLERGEMINPATGQNTAYEETWRDHDSQLDGPELDKAIFLRNINSTSWYTRVGRWQLGLGRDPAGSFWAFQAELVDQEWRVHHRTGITDDVKLLPEVETHWVEGKEVEWNEEKWQILEKD
ncbi:hypothetical protein C8R42DRAFT_699382 [Lentinula raphanica]|nr:hypothetical protein C8R42DRAFT_699382 [Lentinula raphanica]